jgi:hypothetical protein
MLLFFYTFQLLGHSSSIIGRHHNVLLLILAERKELRAEQMQRDHCLLWKNGKINKHIIIIWIKNNLLMNTSEPLLETGEMVWGLL